MIVHIVKYHPVLKKLAQQDYFVRSKSKPKALLSRKGGKSKSVSNFECPYNLAPPWDAKLSQKLQILSKSKNLKTEVIKHLGQKRG